MSKQVGYLNKIKPAIRFLKELRPVLYDQKWFKSVKNPEKFEVYYVYRNIKRKGDLRYDITIIPAKMLGQEFPKTKGHRHFGKTQEVFQVLKGRAFYFVQKITNKLVKDCYVVKVKKGDTIIIPPGYDHFAINPAREKLVMANWISEKAKYDYSSLESFRGGAYFYTKNGWLKNKNYKNIPKLKFQKTEPPWRNWYTRSVQNAIP